MWACIACGAALGMLYQAFQLLTPPHFQCAAKLVASPTFMAFKPEDNGISDRDPSMVTTYVATLVETLESPELQHRARKRIRALSPELAESDVHIRAEQSKGAAIFNVAASGSDGVYARAYLNALLDEFIAFRQAVRSQSQSRFFKRLFDEFEERRAASSKVAEPAERDRLEAAYKTLFERLAEYKTRIEDSSDVAIYERAGAGTKEVKSRASSLGFGAGLGMILGAAFWHIAAIARGLRSRQLQT